MNLLVVACLLFTALVHSLPVVGVLGADRLARLYGIEAPDPAVTLLLRHRAVLFGILAALCVGAALVASWRRPVFAAMAVSVGSYLVLLPRTANPELRRVGTADWAALVAVVLGAAAEWVRTS